MPHLVAPGWLPLQSALNLRDVGGLPVRGGGEVRHRALLRSGSLRLLTTEDADVLATTYGVATVADLRTTREVASDGPSQLARLGVATAHLPLITDLDRAMDHMEDEHDAVAALATAYRGFLDRRGQHVVTAARLLAWSGSGSLLVHCALGKDRTGVVIAMLLDAVGVDRGAIVEDYTATNDVVDSVLPLLVGSLGLTGKLDAIPLAARIAQPDALQAMLDQLDQEHGGAAGWLRSHGLDASELDLLRRRLVTR